MKRDWLFELKKRIKMEEIFYSEMDAQLSADFEKITQEPIEGFTLIPSFGTDFQVNEGKDYYSLKADLLNIDIVFPVRIAWVNKEGGYSFWWLDLPFLEIKKELSNRRDITFETKFSFDVAIKNPVWPHVKLTFHTEAEFNPDYVEEKIQSLCEKWNKIENSGAVHNVGKLTQLNNSDFLIKIDLGSTGMDFFTHLLKELDKSKIIKVTIDS